MKKLLTLALLTLCVVAYAVPVQTTTPISEQAQRDYLARHAESFDALEEAAAKARELQTAADRFQVLADKWSAKALAKGAQLRAALVGRKPALDSVLPAVLGDMHFVREADTNGDKRIDAKDTITAIAWNGAAETARVAERALAAAILAGD